MGGSGEVHKDNDRNVATALNSHPCYIDDLPLFLKIDFKIF